MPFGYGRQLKYSFKKTIYLFEERAGTLMNMWCGGRWGQGTEGEKVNQTSC